MAEKSVVTARLSTELKDRLQTIADAFGRPRSWAINRALEEFAARQSPQTAEIEKGVAEADAGDFATAAEVGSVFAKWRDAS